MYTTEELRDMDKGALVCLVGALQDDAERYRWMRDTSMICASDIGCGVFLPNYDTSQRQRSELDNHLDQLRALSDQQLAEQVREALNQ